MSDMAKDQIEDLAKRLDAFADGDVHEARRDALLGMHPEQNDYEIWAGLMTQAASALRQLMNEQKWRDISSAPQNIAFADVWSVTTRDGNLVCQMRVPNAQHRDGKWCDGGGYEINKDVIEMDDVHYVRKVTHFMEQPLPPLPSPPETADV